MNRSRPDCFLSFSQVAELVGLAEKSIRNGECGTDQLLRIRLGRRVVFSSNDVQAWIERQKRLAQEQRDREAAAGDNESRKIAERLRRKQFVKDTVLRLLK